jgi:hypothetical protein
VGEWRNATLLRAESSNPLQVEALVLERSGSKRILLADLGRERRRVVVHGIGTTATARIRSLDERTARTAMTDPERWRGAAMQRIGGNASELTLELLPFALVRIDTQ